MIKSGKCFGNCCAYNLFPKAVWEKYQNIAQEATHGKNFEKEGEVFIYTTDGKCPFLDRKDFHCLIYEDRPDVCKMYGLSDKLPCPFIKPNGNPRSEAGCRHWQRFINHDVDNKLNYLKKKYGVDTHVKKD